MKYLLYFLIAAGLLTINLQSCSDRDDPGDNQLQPLFNSNDSAAFCEILEMAYGPHLNDLCRACDMKLDRIRTWPGNMVLWEWFEDIKQYRIVQFNLGVYDDSNRLWDTDKILEPGNEPPEYPDYGRVSPRIWDLDSLTILKVGYKLFRGDFPPYKEGKGKRVNTILISKTNISSIPLEMMTLPNLIRLTLNYNQRFSKMPDGFESLPVDNKSQPTIYEFTHNALNGPCPANLSRKMWFDNNEFDSVDWEQWEKTDFRAKLLGFTEKIGVIGPILRKKQYYRYNP